MSTTAVEMPQQPTTTMGERSPSTKNLSAQPGNMTAASTNPQEKSQQHPLHQYDWTVMGKFLDSCVHKMNESQPKWKPSEWANSQPMPTHLPWEQKNEWCNPLVMSQKQRVYESFAKLARETGEPMILMPSFDYGDILNFERFLQALKKDGVNAIGKYKQYLSNKDMRKFEVDLVVMHARYGIMLVEVKDCDHLDSKRRSRARAQLNQARGCFETMGRLIIEAKGWTTQEAQIPITEFIALPNVQVRPLPPNHQSTLPQQHHQPLLSSNIVLQPVVDQNQSVSSGSSSTNNGSSGMSSRQAARQMHYIIKSDMENGPEFAKWWTKYVVEPKQQQQKQAEADNKVNKFDVSVLNWMTGLINCIRNNSIMPVVYPECGNMFATSCSETSTTTTTTTTTVEKQECEEQKPVLDKEETHHHDKQHMQALNLHGEFFPTEHESVRSLPKVVVTCKDVEQIRKTVCLQTLWLLLNDSQKKISVVCSDLNKPYYEEFFARQRKLYNNLNNVRFFTDLHSCVVNAQPTLKKDNDIWFFDSAINGTLANVMERVKDLNAFWIFNTQEEQLSQFKNEFETMNVKMCKLDHHQQHEQQHQGMPKSISLKFPLRMQCDLLVIGDIIDSTQMKTLYHVLEKNTVTSQAVQYQNPNSNHYGNQSGNGNHHYQHQHQQQQKQKLNFNPAKKFKSVKFIRGGTIDNLRNSLKMHDSIQAQVVLLHVGDEDLFKTRNSLTTSERIKELANLVKEYCPNSFIILSTLMRRMSRTENTVSNEVNKGIISFCKQTREQSNFHYMLNNHFEPDYHTQGGRVLVNNGLRLYIENILFVVDYFMMRHNKQH